MRFQQNIQVIDSHTAGHPTRVILGGLPPLRGHSVRQLRDDFRKRLDHLRPALLHEPRGHAAMVGAVVCPSEQADYGVFFISSYAYLDMCGHATIGLAKTLAATGQIDSGIAATDFSLETPAGIVRVTVTADGGEPSSVSFHNVPSYLLMSELEISDKSTVIAAIAYGGCHYAIVDAPRHGWSLTPDTVSVLCRHGAEIKREINTQLAAQEITADEGPLQIDSVLFFEDCNDYHARHLVVLEANKFDRSPCGTGTSARLAQLSHIGRLKPGQPYQAESVLGTRFEACIEETGVDENSGRPYIIPRISGMAHITAFATLVVEAGDPLAGGFLCG